MARKRILRVATSTLKPGEILAQDIIINNKTIARGGILLRKDNIEILKSTDIMLVNIFTNPERELAELKYDEIIEKGLQYALSRKLNDAETYFGFALRKNKEHIDANLYKGVTLFLMERYDESKQRFRFLIDLLLIEQHKNKDTVYNIKSLKNRVRSYIEQCDYKLDNLNFFTKLLYKFHLKKFEKIRFTDYDEMIPRINENITEDDLLEPDEFEMEDYNKPNLVNNKNGEPIEYNEFKEIIKKYDQNKIQKEIDKLETEDDFELWFTYGKEMYEKNNETFILMRLMQNPNFIGDNKFKAADILEKEKLYDKTTGS